MSATPPISAASAGSIPCLYLLPTPLGEGTDVRILVPATAEVLLHTRLVFAENARTARRFISSLKLGVAIESYTIVICDKNTPLEELYAGVKQIIEVGSAVMMSEAGCPAVADPGARLVALCHQLGVVPRPLPGPNSLLLALMGSGFNGQRFAFHGYAPIAKPDRVKFLRDLERDSAKNDQTQILIETPYRNNQLAADLISSLKPDTRYCIAADLTTAQEQIVSKPVSKWKAQLPDFHKRAAVHLLYATS